MRRNDGGGTPLRRGDIVALRSPSEILETLDGSGSLDGLPFMTEMLGHFGSRFPVVARVERACDTITYSGARRMLDTVILDEVRCDGAGHGGCQAGCRIYWKEAWLRRADDAPIEFSPDTAFERLRDLTMRNSRPGAVESDVTDTYRCQATEFLRATVPLGWWDARSFLREVSSRNVSLWTFVRVMSRLALDESLRRLRLKESRPFRPRSEPPAERRPTGIALGAAVKVRSADQIAETLDQDGKLRGLWFDREMLPYCGTAGRVQAQVKRFVDETSGAMIELKSDCYILEGVVCKGHLSEGRWFCPRAIYPWWREAWLDPAATDVTSSPRRTE